MAVTGVFARQRKHSRQAGHLLMLFIVALVAIACFMHLQAGLLSYLLGHGTEADWLFSDYALTLMALAYGMILLGATFRYLELRAGGSVVARHYGAVAIERSNSATKKEKALMNIIDEISIAANQQAVPLWLLPQERGINAFVVGGENDYALVVSRGSLDTLNTQQLRAMVAHEVAHISNHDLPLNMQVLVALSGLLAIQQIAKLAINSGFLPATIAGYALYLCALPGVVGASFVAMAFSRQREFLTDAKAVQLTRNPPGLAEALSFANRQGYSTRMYGAYADEIEGLCFLPFGRKDMTSALFPRASVLERIAHIDPYFYVRKDTMTRQKSRENNPQTVASSLGLGVVSQASLINSKDGELTLDSSNATLGGISGELPDQLIFALQAEHASEAILFALLFYHFDGNNAVFLKAMELKGRHQPLALVKRFQTTLAGMLASHDVEIIRYVAEQLKGSLSVGQLKQLYQELCQVSRLDGAHSLHEFLLLERMALALGVATEIDTPNRELDLEESVCLVLALIVGASGQGEGQLTARYASVLKVYGYEKVSPELTDPSRLIDNLKSAFATLRGQMPISREAFVRHCAEIILDDGHITRIEQALLDLLSSSLRVATPTLH